MAPSGWFVAVILSDGSSFSALDWKALPSRDSRARLIEPMLLLPAETLPEGLGWTYELKLDGYRALAIKTGGQVRFRSRNDKDFNRKYAAIAKALAALPDDAVVDGEVVALDEEGGPRSTRSRTA